VPLRPKDAETGDPAGPESARLAREPERRLPHDFRRRLVEQYRRHQRAEAGRRLAAPSTRPILTRSSSGRARVCSSAISASGRSSPPVAGGAGYARRSRIAARRLPVATAWRARVPGYATWTRRWSPQRLPARRSPTRRAHLVC